MDGLAVIVNSTAVILTGIVGLSSLYLAPRRTVLVAFGLLMLWLLMGCSALPGKTYAEIGIGYNGSLFAESEAHKWDNAGSPGFYGSLRQEFPLDRDRFSTFVQYTHYSQWLAGPPFNDDAESSLDHIGVGVRWRIDSD